MFLDAWKRDYKRFLDLVGPRLRARGLFLAHNVVNKQAEMRDFLSAIRNDSRFLTTIVKPSDEGMSVSLKAEMKSVHIIGVPLDLGGGRRGVDMGPSAFRSAGLGERLAALGCEVVDKGDLPAPIPETQEQRDERKKYIREIAKVCQKVYQTALESLDEGALPLVLGGDHSLGAGSVAAAADWAAQAKKLPLGLLWIDAHGDMNTPATSLSRQRARDAARGAPRARTRGARQDRHDLARRCCRRTPCSSASATSTSARRSRCAIRTSTSSR